MLALQQELGDRRFVPAGTVTAPVRRAKDADTDGAGHATNGAGAEDVVDAEVVDEGR